MFGSEQAWVQSRASLQYLYRLIGEFRFPLRLRGYYLGQILPIKFKPQSIWDAGCGAGHTSFFLARRFPMAEVVGTDLSGKSIDRCKQIGRLKRTTGIHFEVSDLVSTNVENAYDLVVCFEVLEHIENYDSAVYNLSNALKPGGYLIIHTPAAGRFQGPQFGIRRFQKPGSLPAILEKGRYHVRPGFKVKTLVESIERQGLIVDRIESTFGPLAMHAHTLYELARSRSFYLLLNFPFLISVGLIDWYLPSHEGGGLLIRAKKVVPETI